MTVSEIIKLYDILREKKHPVPYRILVDAISEMMPIENDLPAELPSDEEL